jgi:tetratricopeptide (TPR) repeat protein
MYYNLTEPRDEENYILENKLREQILTMYTDTLSQEYKMSLAKKYGSNALYLMEKGDYEKAIVSSNKSIKIMEKIKKPDLVFKGYLYRFLYHQYAYSGDWQTALPMTRKTKAIFMDTLVANHKLVADVEFDIGFVASQFGDIATVIKQFEIAKEKYISFQGKDNYDVGQKYMHLSTVYGNIGYYQKELNCLLEGIKIWEAIDYPDKSYQAIAYGNTSTCYLQHGNQLKKPHNLIKEQG